VVSPTKLAPSYFNIDVFSVGFFPEFFIRDDSRPPNILLQWANNTKEASFIHEISGSHGGEYELYTLLGWSTVESR
jgi:hypothetical protein